MRIALLSSESARWTGDGHVCPLRLRGLAQALLRAGHDVSFLCATSDPSRDGALRDLPVRVLRSPVSVREIDWHFTRITPEIVIENYAPGSLEGVRAATEAGIPHVYDLDGQLHAGSLATSAAVRGALPEALAASRGVMVSSEALAGRVRALFGRACPVAVVPNAAEPEFLQPPAADLVERAEQLFGLGDTSLRVGYFGSIGGDAGLLPLVEAVGALGQARKARLLVVGDGPERNAALRLAERTRTRLVLCGRVRHEDVAAHLALCQVVVAPTDPEGGAPLSMLEAMALQRAVVAPATDAVRAVARDGREACLVPPGDAAALADALVALADDPMKRARLGGQARETVRAGHVWDNRVEHVESFLRGVCAAAAEAPDTAPADWPAHDTHRALTR
jgi:glycosyltransferase involved in cell wall biosynthesis